MKTVVSFADGAGNYIKAMARLELSLKQVGFEGHFYGINDYGHIESPLHKGPNSVPYAFKALSIKKAMENGGLLLWCDSVIYAVQSIDPVFELIKQHGVLLFDNIGFSIGDYTSDACLDKFGMTRNESFKHPMIMACVMGFDLDNPLAQRFLKSYINAASDGVSYPGAWTNNNCEVSHDMRCKGHRHDQSVASLLAYQYGIEIQNAQKTCFAYESHKGIVPMDLEKICLWSGGL